LSLDWWSCLISISENPGWSWPFSTSGWVMTDHVSSSFLLESWLIMTLLHL
jgi:hypothetical protein